MSHNIRVLMLTSEWPSQEKPYCVPFIVRQVKFLRKSGIYVDVFHFRGKGNPQNYLQAKLELRDYSNRKKYNLIHAQWGQSAFLAFPKKLPLVVTYRGSDLEGIPKKNGHYSRSGKLLSLGSRIISRFADQVILVSDHLGRKLPGRSYHLIPSGINLDLFKPGDKEKARNAIGLPLDQPIVLFVGNAKNQIKRSWLAERAVDMVEAVIPDVNMINPNGVPHYMMPAYFNSSDVLLLTSIHEGSPNVVKEALACNLPVVSTDVGDVRERIGDIEGCVVCADDRPETIAAALIKVLNRGKRIEGRQAILELDENLLTQKLITVYRQALNHG